MRQHINEIYANGEVVERTVIDWTVLDYDEAIAASPPDLQSLLDERAVLLGTEAMAARIDQVADAKRMQFLGDVTRAFEYQAAERDAKAYADAGFTGETPANVKAWADATGMTTKQAAENILQEAALYNYALNAIRAYRLQGKQQIRNGSVEQVTPAYFAVLTMIRGIGG